MRFDTPTFWLFFVLAWTAWRLLPFGAAKGVALLASLCFYAWWDPRYVVLIAFSAAIDFLAGGRIHASREPRARRAWLWVSLVSNLGLLGFFKYTPFLVGTGSALVGAQAPAGLAEWVVPVGISFYTFQTLSYTIDVYRGRLVPTRSFLDFFLFVSFFPQLVAGPIVRASELLPQFRRRRRLLPVAVQTGVYLCVWGMFMKVVVADNLGPMVERLLDVPDPGQLTPTAAWLGALYFLVQIFADFAGYSAIAIGLAYLMGLRFPENFRAPYLARGPLEFWRRWHLTLSHWLRDYLYIPLGGSRHGQGRAYLNLLLTMMICGLWHGAAWSYVLFGAIHGGAMGLERLLRGPGRHTDVEPPPRGARQAALRLAEMGATLVFLLGSFVVFRVPSVEHSLGILGRMFLAPFREDLGLGELANARHLLLCLPVLGVHLVRLREEWWGRPPTVRARTLWASIMLFLLLVVARDRGDAFVYFQF